MDDARSKMKGRSAQGKKMFLLILPFLILSFLFSYFPLHGWIYAFYDYRAPMKLSQCEFVGFKWFQMLFSNPTQVKQLLTVLRNTFAMQNAGALAALYGYEPVGFALADSSTKDVQSVIDSDGIYVKALKFLFDANQAGLVDPESTTQNFDTLNAKYTSGQILYSFWPWLGAGYYNSTDNTAAGKGFETAVIDDMKCLSYGSYTLGKMGNGMFICFLNF